MSIDTPNFVTNDAWGLTLKGTVSLVVDFIAKDPKNFYKVIVGSDTSSGGLEPCSTSIITAVIVWRVGRGAIYFLTKSTPQLFYTRRDRLIRETMSSLTLAQEVRSRLKDALGEDFLWDGNEIHADVGNGGESRDCIKEVTGLIRGFDFVPVLKPEAWGASCVADKHT
jgi:uncharacterized protein